MSDLDVGHVRFRQARREDEARARRIANEILLVSSMIGWEESPDWDQWFEERFPEHSRAPAPGSGRYPAVKSVCEFAQGFLKAARETGWAVLRDDTLGLREPEA
jgi:hypothetical protein